MTKSPDESAMAAIVQAMHRAGAGDQAESRNLDNEYHLFVVRYCDNRYLADAYETIGHRAEALRTGSCARRSSAGRRSRNMPSWWT